MWLELVLRWIWLVLNFTIRKELWNYYLIYAIVLLIAYLTNPNEALFRHFLNDLTFHRHLRKLHSPVENTPHVLTFNNRIKVTLRTPPYVIRSYLFFSTAVMSNAVSNSFQPQRLSDRHPSSTQSLAATGRKKKPSSTASTHEFLKNASSKTSPNLALPLVDPLAKEKTKSLMMNTDVQSFNMTSREGFYLGAFGRWWKLDDGLYDDPNEEIERVGKSIIKMEEVKEETDLEGKVPYNVEVVKGVNEDGEKEVKFRVHIEDEDELEEEAASDSSDSPAAFQHSNTSNTNLSASTGSNGLAPPTTYHRSSARSSTTSYASPVFRAGQRRPSPISPAALKRTGKTRTSTSTPSTTTGYLNANTLDRQHSNRSVEDDINTTTPKSPAALEGTRSRGNSNPNPHSVRDKRSRSGSEPASKSSSNVSGPASNAAPSASLPTPTTPNSTVVSNLKAQINEVETSFETQESKLQSELNDLKDRKKEEDRVRSDLKSKVKKLEEQKREVEAVEKEEEKKLDEVKKRRRDAESKLERAKVDIARVERKEKEKDEREKKVEELKKELKKKKEKAVEEVEEMKNAENLVAGSEKLQRLQKEVTEKKEQLERRRRGRRGLRAHAAKPFVPSAILAAPKPPSVDSSPPSTLPQIVTGGVVYVSTPETCTSVPVANSPDCSPTDSQDSPLKMMPEEDAHEAVSFPTASALSAYSSEFHPKSSLASSIGAVGSASAHEPPFALPGFYEHRLQHYRDRKNSANRSSSSMENVHGAIGSGSNFSSKRNSLIQEESAPFGSFGLGSTCHAPPISLPFQFMNNGLLPTDAVTSTPESEAPTAVPASPVTPHQAALLPSQLFDLLEQQEDAPPSNLGSWPHYGLSDEDGEEIGYRSVGELGGMALPRRDDGLVFEPISPTPRTTNLPAAAYGPYFTGYDTQRAAPPRRPAALNPDAKSFSPQTKTRGSRSSTLSIELPNASAAMPGITGQHYSPFTPASSMTAPKAPTSLWNDVWSSASTRVENSPLSAPAMEKDATLTGGIVDKEFEDDYDPLLVPYTR